MAVLKYEEKTQKVVSPYNTATSKIENEYINGKKFPPFKDAAFYIVSQYGLQMSMPKEGQHWQMCLTKQASPHCTKLAARPTDELAALNVTPVSRYWRIKYEGTLVHGRLHLEVNFLIGRVANVFINGIDDASVNAMRMIGKRCINVLYKVFDDLTHPVKIIIYLWYLIWYHSIIIVDAKCFAKHIYEAAGNGNIDCVECIKCKSDPMVIYYLLVWLYYIYL